MMMMVNKECMNFIDIKNARYNDKKTYLFLLKHDYVFRCRLQHVVTLK